MLDSKNSIDYAAFKAKDARFDGLFFVGISSTGIYCRPICRARLPKPENCTFFNTAAAAEQAGFRPCLLCRPELAPGVAPVDASRSLAQKAAILLEQNTNNDELTIAKLAEQLGYSDRHLRKVFSAEYHVSPIQYLQTCRLLLAKNLLTDTQLSITEVAMAAGFASLRRFNEVFKKHYRLTPTALRRLSSNITQQTDTITLTLGYRPPYQWQQIIDFLAARAIEGVEVVSKQHYMRTVRFTTQQQQTITGWIKVTQRPQHNQLAITFSFSLLPVLAQLLNRIRYLFDLYCEPDAVYETLQTLNTIHKGLVIKGARLAGCFDPFEVIVHTVLTQDTSLELANTLVAKLTKNYGKIIDSHTTGLTYIFPSPAELLAVADTMEELLGITKAQADTILQIAHCLVTGIISFNSYQQPAEIVNSFKQIAGIKAWTAQYIVMRAMNWPDAFPYPDTSINKILAPRSTKQIQALAEQWRPWRSYAVLNLWNFYKLHL